jgi:PQQ-like domain
MTFWNDARPATPRFRLRRPRARVAPSPRPLRSRGRGRRPGPRSIAVGLVVLTAVVAAALVVFGAGSEPASTVSAAPRRRSDRASAIPVVPARWSATLRHADYPQLLLHDARDDAIVIGDNWVHEIDIGDGDSNWRAHTERLNRSAALRADTILLSTEAGFVALDRATGVQRWRTDTPETPSAVALVGPAGTPAVAMVSTHEGGLVGLDSRTGRPRWSVRFPGYIGGTPAPDDDSGLVATVWRQNDGGRLRLIDASSGAVRWERRLPLLSGSPIITTGPGGRRMVIVGAGNGDYDSEVRAYDLVAGGLRWRAPVPASFQTMLAPLADGSDLYVLDQLSNVTRLDLATGRRRWSTDTGSIAIQGSPARAGDAILVTNFTDDVFTLDRATGTIRARRRTAGFPTDLLVAHGTVLVAQRLVEEHQIQAFPANRIAAAARKPE